MEQEAAYWLAWSKIEGIGAVSLKKISQHFDSLEQAWQAPVGAVAEVDGLQSKVLAALDDSRRKLEPEQLWKEHKQANTQFWTPADPLYPRLLWETPSPPPLLYYLGQVDIAENSGNNPLIGIVGTRNPTEYGKRWTKKITQALVKHGFGIVSGMAAGIDAIAHQTCLEVGGRTIAVLGTGVDVIYPYSNRGLYQRLIREGLIVSEYPAQTGADRHHFPTRNRIIAGWCRAVLIMEAPQRSGALITARFANDFCRDVYVLPGSLDNPNSIGCLKLINSGAHVILGVEQLLEMLGTIPHLDQPPQTKAALKLSPELKQIYSLISVESVALDTLVAQTGLDTSELLSRLSQLELLDLVQQIPGMRYQLAN